MKSMLRGTNQNLSRNSVAGIIVYQALWSTRTRAETGELPSYARASWNWLSWEFCMDERHYGYSLVRVLSESGSISLKEGTIYPILGRLNRDGLVRSEWVESD